MQVISHQYQTSGSSRPSLRCPACRQNGIFEVIHNLPDVQVQMPTPYKLGIKQCPNNACGAMVYLVMSSTHAVIQSFPAERIDFDTASIPLNIVACLEEALTCHAHGCHVACAILIRRTLELLCEERLAVGGNLKDRIGNLRSKVILPKELFEAMDELRMLGNDAAHVEAKMYAELTADETEAAIELTREILKAVYQLDGLVKRLQALKKP